MASLKIARNGCCSVVELSKKKVFFVWDDGKNLPQVILEVLGNRLDKNTFIDNNIIDKSNTKAVQYLLVDWVLYEKGWLVGSSGRELNEHLFKYLQDMGAYRGKRPEELRYVKGYD